MRNAAWAPLEIAINRVLALDPAAPARLEQLEGRTLAVELRGLALTVYFLFARERISVLGDFDGETDARIVGTPLSLARVAVADSGPQALFGQGVEVCGNVDVARRAKAILDSLDIDWEERLAAVAGDVVAHQVGHAVRGVLGWSKMLVSTLNQDMSEFLQHESNLLPEQGELQLFTGAVDDLRSDIDRLSQRVQRLAAAMQITNEPADAGTTPSS